MAGENTRYVLTLNREQARAVCTALELHARLGMGQFEEIHPLWMSRKGYDREVAVDAIRMLKAASGLSQDGYLGAGSPELPEACKVSWDIYQVLRREIARMEGHPSTSVWHHDPLRESLQPLPTVETKSPFGKSSKSKGTRKGR